MGPSAMATSQALAPQGRHKAQSTPVRPGANKSRRESVKVVFVAPLPRAIFL